MLFRGFFFLIKNNKFHIVWMILGLCTVMENYLCVCHTRTVLVAALLQQHSARQVVTGLDACGSLQQMQRVLNISLLVFGSEDMNGEVRNDKSLFTPQGEMTCALHEGRYSEGSDFMHFLHHLDTPPLLLLLLNGRCVCKQM